MFIDQRKVEQIIFKQFANNLRFTQDSPIYPDVWLEYFKANGNATNDSELQTYRCDLILSPHRQSTAAELFLRLSEKLSGNVFTHLSERPNPWDMASSGETVVARLTLYELITVALPMTNWWHRYLWKADGTPTAELRWVRILVGAILMKGQSTQTPGEAFTEALLRELEEYFITNFNNLVSAGKPAAKGKKAKSSAGRKPKDDFMPAWFKKPTATDEDAVLLWSVNRNRPASITLERSVAARRRPAPARTAQPQPGGDSEVWS